MNIGATLKELRKLKGISQIELSKKTNITQAALSNIENGKRPATETLEKISKVLKVSVPYIYILSMEKNDGPKENEILFDELFPIIKELVIKVSLKN